MTRQAVRKGNLLTVKRHTIERYLNIKNKFRIDSHLSLALLYVYVLYVYFIYMYGILTLIA